MTPVMLLSDGYIANGSRALAVPDVAANCRRFRSPIRTEGDERFPSPYEARPETARPSLGDARHAGLEHRIGGLEKQDAPATSPTTRRTTST
jgi:2-oxoglutarate ferredoxin oxidoreductase subunit alpha